MDGAKEESQLRVEEEGEVGSEEVCRGEGEHRSYIHQEPLICRSAERERECVFKISRKTIYMYHTQGSKENPVEVDYPQSLPCPFPSLHSPLPAGRGK